MKMLRHVCGLLALAVVPFAQSAPTITTQPTGGTLTSGWTNATLTVTATASSGTLSYQWKKDGVALANTTTTVAPVTRTLPDGRTIDTYISGATSATLSITNWAPANAGNYTVTVTDTTGSIDSNVAAVTVTDVAPTIVNQSPTTQVISDGGRAKVFFNIAGSRPLNVQWFKDGVALGGANGSSTISYDVDKFSAAQAGTYTATVSNAFGSVSLQPMALTLASTKDPIDLWRWINPRPQGNNLITVTSGGGRVVLVGRAGATISSTDGQSGDVGTAGTGFHLSTVVYDSAAQAYIAAGGFSTIMRSTDAKNWTPKSLTGVDDGYNGSATDNTGTIILAGSNFTTRPVRGLVRISRDGGNTWVTPDVVPAAWAGLSNVQFTSATFGNGRFVIVGTGGLAFSSNDGGRNWTQSTTPTTQTLQNVSFGNGKFVAVGNSGTLLTSTDGQTFVAGTSGTTQTLFGVNYLASSSTWVAVGAAGTVRMSTDGAATWSTPAGSLTTVNSDFFSVAENANITVITGALGRIFLRPVASTFDLNGWENAGDNVQSDIGGSINYVDWDAPSNQFLAVGGSGNVHSSAAHADDWFRRGQNPTGGFLTQWARLNNTLLASGSSGVVLSSVDNGTTWTANATTATTTQFNSIAVGAGRAVVVGAGGNIFTSTNGTTWTAATSGVTSTLRRVTYANSQFVAVGGNDTGGTSITILTSPDGLTWTARTAGTTGQLWGVDYASGTWVAVGAANINGGGGFALRSTDNGVTWSRVEVPGMGFLFTVRQIDGRWIATGSTIATSTPNALAVSSDAGASWGLKPVPASPNINTLRGVAKSPAGAFVVVGNDATILASGILPPIILSQPAPATVAPNGGVTLSVAVNSPYQLSYQWRLNGTNITGATSQNLFVGNFDATKAGTYDVVITATRTEDGNAVETSSITSTGALLTLASGAGVTLPDLGFQSPQFWRHSLPGRLTAAPGGKVYATFNNGNFVNAIDNQFVGAVVRLNTDGSRDTSFNPGTFLADAWAVVPLSDGKVLVSGVASHESNETGLTLYRVYRLNADGSRDGSFNSPHFTGVIRFMTLQSDGKLLVTPSFGSFTNNGGFSGLIRLNTDGSYDSTFNPPTFNTTNPLFAQIVVDANGKIVIGGAFTTVNGVARNSLARLNADGSLDTTFVPAGYSFSGQIRGLAVQAQGANAGKILVTGGTLRDTATNTVRPVLRFNTDGTLDTTFTLGPITDVVGAAGVRPRLLNLLPDDRFTVVSDKLVRYQANGALDTTFATATLSTEAFWIDTLSDGSVLLPPEFGTTFNGQALNTPVRINASGALDTGFNPGRFQTAVYPRDFHVQADGKILVWGGFDTVNSSARPGFARLNADGSLAPLTLTGIANLYTLGAGSVLSDGRLLAVTQVGTYRTNTTSGIARFATDGTVDTTFSLAAGVDPANLYVLPDNKILTWSLTANNILGTGLSFQRLLVDGAVDSAFTGLGSTAFGRVHRDASNIITEIVLGQFRIVGHYADGRALAVATTPNGTYAQGSGSLPVTVLRLNTDGTIDTTFNAPSLNWSATAGFTTAGVLDPVRNVTGQWNLRQVNGSPFTGVVPQADGSVIVFGSFTSLSGVNTPGIARLTNTGAVDTAFSVGSGPEVRNNPGRNPWVQAIDIAADGKIWVAGNFDTFGGRAAPGLARLNSDGSVDTTFVSGARYVPFIGNGSKIAFGATGGTYVSGTFATGNQLPAALTRLVVTSAPVIITQPTSVGVSIGGSTTLSVVVSSGVSVSYQWLRNGQTLSGATNSTLQLTNVQNSDLGDYTVRVTTTAGTVTSNVATVFSTPFILSQPVPRKVVQGGKLLLRFGAGGGNLTYQWTKDGQNVGTNSADLVIESTQNSDAGTYVCTATNSYGNVQSATTTVTVLPADNILWTQFADQSTEQAPSRLFSDGQGRLYLPWSVNRNPDVAAGRLMGTLARFDEGTGALDTTFKLDRRFNRATWMERLADGRLLIGVIAGDASYVIRTSATGTVDTTFTTTAFGRSIRFLKLQADGKILVAVVDNPIPGSPITLAAAAPGIYRLNADGSLDSSFTPAILNSVGLLFGPPEVDTAGRIYLAGAFSSVSGTARLNVARLNSDGTVDSLYAANPPAGFGSTQARAVALQSDGRAIFVGDFRSTARGTAGNPIMAIRYNADGTYDTSFAQPLRSELGLAFGRLRHLIVANDDTMVVVGDRLARLTANGARDPNFASYAFDREGFWVARTTDGRYLVADLTWINVNGIQQPVWGNGVAAFSSSGQPDFSYQLGGYGRSALASSARILSNGDVWLAGTFNRYGARYLPGIGKFTSPTTLATAQTTLPAGADAPTIANPTGNVAAAAGDQTFALWSSAALARLNADGTTDTTFVAAFPSGYNAASATLYAAPAGRVVLAQPSISAASALAGNIGNTMLRLNADGSRDTSFTPNLSSFAVVERATPSTAPTRIATGGINVAQVLTDGRMLVIVSAVDGTLKLQRLNNDGSLDTGFTAPSFGTITPSVGFTTALLDPVTNTTAQWNSATYQASDLVRTAVQTSDGKVYVGGRFALDGAPRGLVRLNSDGTLDNTFTGAGIATTFSDANAYVSSLTLDSTGRLYVAGRFSSFNGTALPGIFRLTPAGTLDTAWAPGFSVFDQPTAAVQLTIANGRLYAVGSVGTDANALPAPYASVALSFPPTITTQPTATVTIADGGALNLSVVATGTGSLTYQWFFNGELITGATGSNLFISPARANNAGAYTVAVSSTGGTTVSSAATVTVNTSAPTFNVRGNITGTFGYVVAAGSSASLFVTPSAGSLPITYQWKFNGVDIPGATEATYALADWQPAHAGAYSVAATNAHGTTVSPAEIFHVMPEAGFTWASPRPTGNGTTGVLFTNNRFIIGGLRGTLLTSTDGTTWSSGNLTGSNNIVSFALGNGTYVGVGTLGALYYSPDGTNWEPTFQRPTAAQGTLNEVVFGLGRFVVVGTEGLVGTSTDGRNWTFTNLPGSTGDNMGGLVVDDEAFFALTDSNKVLTSTNGSTWTQHGTIPTTLNSLALSTAPEGGAVAVGPQGQIFSTNDGTTWTPRTSGTTQEFVAVRYLNNQYIAVGLFGTLATSPDGVTWTLRTTGTQSHLWSVAYGAGRFVVTGQAGNSGRNILTSTDGVTWTSSITGNLPAAYFTAVATNPNTNATVAVGVGGTIYSSTDLTTWTLRASPHIGELTDVIFAQGLFAAVSTENAQIITSLDGTTWIQRTTTGLTTTGLRGIAYDNSTSAFVAVGKGGGIWTSPDTNTWTSRSSPTTAQLNKVLAAGGKLVAVSQAGEILTATDSNSTWTRTQTGAGRSLSSVAYGNNTWVAVGNGIAYTSSDALTWTAATFAPVNLTAVKFLQGSFIALANNHSYFTSPDGLTWTGRSSGAFDPLNSATTVSLPTGTRFVAVGNFNTILTGGAPTMPASRSLSVVAGQRVDLNAHASASPLPVTYTWTKGGVAVPGASGYLHTINAASATDAGAYVVTASNAFGSANQTINLTVNTPPTITTQPVATNLPENGVIQLSVGTSGSGTLTYQWFKDGTAITGATSSVINVSSGGSYTVQVSSAFGTVTSSAAVVTVVPSAPVINSVPSVSATFGPVMTTGTAALLQATLVQGTRPMTFQWSFNGTDIPGATGEFIYRTNWQTDQAGIYAVRATNSVGASNTTPGEVIHVTTEGGWRWRNPTPTGNGITRAAFVNNQFLLGGLRGTILTSPDGVAWTPRPIPAQNNVFAVRHVGGRYVAMASLNAIFTSTDSVTWTPRNTGIDGSVSSLQDMTAGPDGRLVAVGTAGVTAVSTDAGETWTTGTLGANNTDSVTGATFTLGRFFAVSIAQGRIYSSPDGVAWNFATVNVPWLRGLAYGAGRLVAVGAAGAIVTSTDGLTWTPSTSGTTNNLLGVNFLNGRFIAVGALGTILTSSDGLTWTLRSAGGNQSDLQNTAYGAGRYVIGGQAGNNGKIILTSTDAVNWTSAIPGPRQNIQFNAAAASNSTLVAVGNSGSILTSTDKATWTDRSSGVATNLPLLDVVYHPTEGRFVAVGAAVITASSDQGATWSLQPTNATLGSTTLNGVAVSSNLEAASGYIVVGNGGFIATTANFGATTTWTRRTSNTSAQLRKVIFAGGQHVVVGGTGVILTSADTATWTTRSTGVSNQLNDVAYGTNTYVAVGNTGTVLRSTDGASWTLVSRFTPANLVSVKFIDGQFIATSQGSGAAYYVSTDGLNWSGRITGAFDPLFDTESFQGEVVGVGAFGTILTAGAPIVNGAPATITANAGSAVRLHFPTWNSAEPVTYAWTKNGNVVSTAPNAPTLSFASVTAGDAGTYRVTASNSKGMTQSADVQLVLNVPVAITAQPQPQTVLVGGSATFSVTATGTPAPSYQWRRNGIDLAGQTSATLTLANLTIADTGAITVAVRNSFGVVVSQAAALTINPLAPAITSPNTVFTVAGAPFRFQIVASAPATFGATGLPAGLALNAATGVIEGNTTQVGPFNVALTATNVSGSANQTLQLTVQPPTPVITSALSVGGRVGQPFTYTIIASNTPTDFGATGLPAGITRTGAVISGTPTAAGFYTAQILASNATGSATAPLSIQIAAPLNAPTFTGSPTVAGTAGVALNFQPAFGGAPTSFTLVNLPDGTPSVLPTGLTLNSTTGAITGTTTQTGSFKLALRATNADGAFTQVFTLTVNPAPTAPAIKSATSTIGTVGTSFTFNITADPAATSFSATALPDGLTLNPSTGAITGTPTTPGITAVTLSATNASGTGTGPLQITINSSASAPVITSAAVAPGRAGVEFVFTLAASNTPTSFLVTQGTLPAGLTLNATTGEITGTPTAAGQTRVWIAASNTAGGRGPAVEMLFDIARALNVPVITSNGTASGQVGATFQYQILATNTPSGYTAAPLPDGLVFSASTGVISGIPNAETTTAFAVTLTATNADGASAPKTLLLTFAPAAATPKITSALSAGGRVGTPFTYQITATETPTSFATEQLPDGLTLGANGLISGTPTTAGTTAVQVRAANTAGLGQAATLTITIAPPLTAPAITSEPTASGKVGVFFSYQIVATNTPTSYAVSGSLPGGLTLNTATGVISGNPADAPALYEVTITASNSAGASQPQSLFLSIAPADNTPVITSASSATGTVGVTFTYQISATNVPTTTPFPASVSLDALSLPAGLAVNASTGLIEGKPTTAGTYAITLYGVNSNGTGASRTLTLTVNPALDAPIVTSPTSANAQVGLPFTYQIIATNNPVAFEALDAPDWLQVNTTSGLLSGTPNRPGPVRVRLSARNSSNGTGGDGSSVLLTIQVAAAAGTPVITSSQIPAPGRVGQAFSYDIRASLNPTSYIVVGLPPGLTVDGATGDIRGTPTQSGTFTVTVSGVNAVGEGNPVEITITILPSLSVNG